MATVEVPHMQNAGREAGCNTLLQSGEVSYKGRGHQLDLTNTGLRLTKMGSKDKTAGGSDAAVIDVVWRQVICACEAPVKKSRSSQSHSESGSPDREQSGVFIIHYMVKSQKTHKLRCKNIRLEASQGRAGEWITKIEEKCKEGKPQKLLIIINPIGGKGSARQTFEKRVRPIFALAGVGLEVKVTERAKHAVEIVKSFDISTVDGVIAVGGDGMYMEVLHGLTLRKQEEEGVDFNDPDTRLVPPTVAVGIIPAGTGNGVSDWLNGVIDVDTAALNIIRGVTSKTNIFSIHEPGKLIHYAGLLFGNGYFSEIIQRTDELRWMKRARYPSYLRVQDGHVHCADAMLSSLVKKKKVLEFSIDVLRCQREPSCKDGRGENASAITTEWTRLGTRQLTATMAFIAKIQNDTELLKLNPFYPGFDLLIVDRSTALENLKFVLGFFTRNKNVLEKEYVEWVKDICGARFEVVQTEESEATSRQQEQIQDLCKILDVDGEVMSVTGPKFDLRLHPQFLPVYCVPELYDTLQL